MFRLNWILKLCSYFISGLNASLKSILSREGLQNKIAVSTLDQENRGFLRDAADSVWQYSLLSERKVERKNAKLFSESISLSTLALKQRVRAWFLLEWHHGRHLKPRLLTTTYESMQTFFLKNIDVLESGKTIRVGDKIRELQNWSYN